MPFKDQLIDFLKKGLMGPNPTEGNVQENGEEIIIGSNPCDRYSLGVLFPQSSNTPKKDEIEDIGSEEATEEVVNLANSMAPSAMGFSCGLISPFNDLIIEIKAGTYQKVDDYESSGRYAFLRHQINYEIKISKESLSACDGILHFPIKNGDEETKLGLILLRRKIGSLTHGEDLFTFSLVNYNNEGRDEKCFFQCQFIVKSVDGKPCFAPYPDISEAFGNDYDRLLNAYLYRDKKTFAIGHGCSPLWNDTKNDVSEICANAIPSYEMKPVIPTTIEGCSLGMYEMSDEGKVENIFEKIETLCREYENWINGQQRIIEVETNIKYKEIGQKNILNCKMCLDRMREGFTLLKTDSVVLEAFRLMNRAMLLQQLHYKIDLRIWDDNDDIVQVKMPKLNDKSTWPDKVGNWYPFQLAFILMNLDSMSDPSSKYREMVDLIWFPTGGGKTEAYLGLTAFTIFLKRLTDKNDDGTTVLMRYTLRLLTNQQFQRASSLICSCEYIRSSIPQKLGETKITIGLWAGSGLTPNTRPEAVSKFKKLLQGQDDVNCFLIDKCPWCGAQMGFIKKKNIKAKGYRQMLHPSTVIFRCSDQECFFSHEESPLPLLVIDEDIYDNPPSLVIGTIDKFAMLVWKPESVRKIFGFRDNGRVLPPSLIIQDELHLISGPLGSIAGMYEVLIEELCSQKNSSGIIKPKIVASTATVSRAKEQVNALYGRDVFILPPPATKANDSFFAKEAVDLPGRTYLGIYAPSLSHATAHVRTVSFLLEGVKYIPADPTVKNYYWTLLDYFNSLRELGHAKTRISADIPEYLNIVYSYLGLFHASIEEKAKRRFINPSKCPELTSRVDEISKALNDLKEPYLLENSKALDICLCTNMISVGIDIDRLGLMTVAGQPKTTAEYIQATSRVGRSSKGPGLVVAIFNTPKPRDRSHYENFLSYHSKIYSFVEPTSITPFSRPARERALHALLIGYIRYFGSTDNLLSPKNISDQNIFTRFTEMIKNRVIKIDPDEMEGCLTEIDKLKRRLFRLHAEKYYGNGIERWANCLIYPYGVVPPDSDTRNRMWPTLQSMRNVDLTCQIEPDTYYLDPPDVTI
ncbi:MAG: helicase-related protein [Candidatus Shapirobacteria bacterium]|nr:helicase-related protein [Candidatus Shapirobacteria bacterium]